jgi:hypothetical protein
MTIRVLTPATATDLVALATLKAELGITDTSQDVALARLIRQASQRLATFCSRTHFGRETVRQISRLQRDADRQALILERDLEPTISTVTEDGEVLVQDEEWEQDGSVLFRLDVSGCRQPWQGTVIMVDYVVGFDLATLIPPDLERACIDCVVAMREAQGRDAMLKSESVLDLSQRTWFDPGTTNGLPPAVAASLAGSPYVYRVIA